MVGGFLAGGRRRWVGAVLEGISKPSRTVSFSLWVKFSGGLSVKAACNLLGEWG